MEAAAARKILQAATHAAAAHAAATVGQFRKKQKLGTASPLMSSPPSGGGIAKHFVRSHDVRSNAEFTVDNADIALEQAALRFQVGCGISYNAMEHPLIRAYAHTDLRSCNRVAAVRLQHITLNQLIYS